MNASAARISKTNAARQLEKAGIPFSLHHVEVDEKDLSAVSMARALDAAPECVFKTLVARGDRTGVLMACIPAAAALDLKALGSRFRQQACGNGPSQGGAAAHRIPARRLFPAGREKSLSRVCGSKRRCVRTHIRERGLARTSALSQARRFAARDQRPICVSGPPGLMRVGRSLI